MSPDPLVALTAAADQVPRQYNVDNGGWVMKDSAFTIQGVVWTNTWTGQETRKVQVLHGKSLAGDYFAELWEDVRKMWVKQV